MVTLLIVNDVKKREVFVHRTDNGDFLVKTEDLISAGFRGPKGAIVRMDGEAYLSLRSMIGVAFSFNEQFLTIGINADPSLLGQTSIELATQPIRNVYYPKESSLFLNYGIEYHASETIDHQSFNLTNELGIRRGDYLFLTDTLYTTGQTQNNLVRLHTSITRDDRQKMRRLVLGDIFASSGTLGSSTNLGGISFSKAYGVDPFFITYPTFQLSGQASLPSEIDLYVNGTKIRTERVAPGEFQLRNLSSYGGAGVVELVIRDSLGREQQVRYPFYAAGNVLLKKDLHDYSYNIGFRRDDFGRESNRYSSLAAVMFHRYGLYDFLTLGIRGEATKDLVNGGPQAAVLLGTLGTLNLSLSGSVGDKPGSAADVSYQYLNRRFNARLFYQFFSSTYRTLASDALGLQQNYSEGAGVGYTHPKWGSLSLDLTAQKNYHETEKHIAAMGYSKDFPGNVYITASIRRIEDLASGQSNEFFVGLSYTPKRDFNFSARHESASGRESDSIQAQKNPPLGEGIGFRAALERNQNAGQPSTYTVNPMLQYNGRHAIFKGEITAIENNGKWTDQYSIGASGALVLLKSIVGLTRPVTDSFAVVKVGDIEGVTVRSGGEDIGKTDSSGRIFVNTLSSYNDNLIAMNDKDIPLEYYFPQVHKLVSPPLRSGSCIGFLVKKMQPITGTLKTKIDGEVKPVEFHEVELTVDGNMITFPTGTGGEFYLDLSQSQQFMKQAEEKSCSAITGETSGFLKPGQYQAAVLYEDRRHFFSLTVPISTDPIIDLGQIIFEASPETNKASLIKTAPTPENNGAKRAPAQGHVATTVATPLLDATNAKPAPHAAELVERAAENSPARTTRPSATVPSSEIPVMEVYFKFGSADLVSNNDNAMLITVSRLMELMPDTQAVISGYTDQIGSQRHNLNLSKRRALAAASGLETVGVPAERIVRINWFGKSHLQCFSLDESCRKNNRRVVIQLISAH